MKRHWSCCALHNLGRRIAVYFLTPNDAIKSKELDQYPSTASGIIMRRHWCDCALYSLPAYFPMRCDCGGVTDDTIPLKAKQLFCQAYNLREGVGRFAQLWTMRLAWKRETSATLPQFLSEAAKQSRLSRLFYRILKGEAPPF